MSMAKRRKLNPDCFESSSIVSNVEFDSLDDECIINIFDWLPINDLCRLRVTCKRLYLLANEHYQKTYKQLVASYEMNFDEDAVENVNSNKYRRSFASLAQKIVCKHGVENLSDIASKLNQNIKYIEFWSFKIRSDSNDLHLKDQLESVKAINVLILSDRLLQLFTNLEYIAFGDAKKLSGSYPMLKQFDWQYPCFKHLEGFFQRHPNIKTFSSYDYNPYKTTKWLLKTGIKFDNLVLRIGKEWNEWNHDRKQVFKNIHSLYENQQIKALHLRIVDIDFLLNPKFQSLKFVESIETDLCGELYSADKIVNAFESLPNLKFMILNPERKQHKHYFELLAQKLDKLEEFHTDAFHYIDDVIPFVRHSKNLKCIYINHCNGSMYENTTTLQMLDKHRRKLKNACKLTIYIKEAYYIRMKNSSLTSSYGLVEIKRTDSYPMSKHPLRPNYRV